MDDLQYCKETYSTYQNSNSIIVCNFNSQARNSDLHKRAQLLDAIHCLIQILELKRDFDVNFNKFI